METVTSFQADAVSPDTLRGILSDHIALEQTRTFRRLLVPRCAVLVLIALIVGFVAHGLSVYVRVIPPMLFSVPATRAWIAERHIAHRLTRRLDTVDDATTRILPTTKPPDQAHR